jgi:hypothetical protein
LTEEVAAGRGAGRSANRVDEIEELREFNKVMSQGATSEESREGGT